MDPGIANVCKLTCTFKDYLINYEDSAERQQKKAGVFI